MRETVLLCKCASGGVLPGKNVEDVLDRLSGRGVRTVVTEDLCRMVQARHPLLRELAKEGRLTIIACYPRAVRWLFHQAGISLDADRRRIINIRLSDCGDIEDLLPGGRGRTENRDIVVAEEVAGETAGWFPVLDYDRCVNCRQCLNFCPFGVYSLSGDGVVTVDYPLKCKDNCPACALMCPSAAIMFPKARQSPIEGAEVSDEELRRRKTDSLARKLKDGDLHSILAERRKKAMRRCSADPCGVPSREERRAE